MSDPIKDAIAHFRTGFLPFETMADAIEALQARAIAAEAEAAALRDEVERLRGDVVGAYADAAEILRKMIEGGVKWEAEAALFSATDAILARAALAKEAQ